jgi:hypothetical protein
MIIAPNPPTLTILSKIIVWSLAVPATESVVVLPISEIPFVIVSVVVQSVPVPAGTITVSPSTAEAMAVLTAAREGLAAVMVLAAST